MSASALTIRRVHHTGFTVSSLREALTFWVDVLGFELLMTDAFAKSDFISQVTGVADAEVTLAMVSGGGHVVELLEYTSPPDRCAIRSRACDVGSTHIALFVDDLDSVLKRVEQHGWKPLGVPQAVPVGPWIGARVTYILGPDGITIELMQPASHA